MKALSGYFQLEIPSTHPHYHKNALRLNTARAAIDYVLQAKKIKKIYLPYYLCESVSEYLNKYEIVFYHINNLFFPEITDEISEEKMIIYPNYYGIHDQAVSRVVETYQHVLIDNTQSFFSYPLKNIDTVYSARKFFGVPDGAYLYTSSTLNKEIETDFSHSRFDSLLKRFELGPEAGYAQHLSTEDLFRTEPIKQMSKLTDSILSAIDYNLIKTMRQKNFAYLHSKLRHLNQIDIPLLSEENVPMVYPFLKKSEVLRSALIAEKIYIPTWWGFTKSFKEVSPWEKKLCDYMLPLPIDHHCSFSDLDRIIKVVNQCL